MPEIYSLLTQLKWKGINQPMVLWRQVITKEEQVVKNVDDDDNELEVGEDVLPDLPPVQQPFVMPEFAFMRIFQADFQLEEWLKRLERVLEAMKEKMQVTVLRSLVIRPKIHIEVEELENPKPITSK